MSSYNNSSAKPTQTNSLDWLSFADDLHAPPPDLFEFELDNSLTSLDQSQLNLLDVLNFTNDSYTFYRDSNVLGPPSTITLSSESTYEGQSTHSESLYSFPRSPTYTESVYSNPSDLQLSFTNVNLNNTAETVPQPQQIALSQQPSVFDDIDINSNSFGELPLPFINRARDYDPNANINPNFSNINPAEFYHQNKNVNILPTPQAGQNMSMPISQLKMIFPTPNITVSMSGNSSSSSSPNESSAQDERRRYQCPSCPRGQSFFTIFVTVSHDSNVFSQPSREPTISRRTWLLMTLTGQSLLRAPILLVEGLSQGSTTLVVISSASIMKLHKTESALKPAHVSGVIAVARVSLAQP